MYKIVLKINDVVSETFLAGDFKDAYHVAMAAGKEDASHWHTMMFYYAKSQVEEAGVNVPVKVAWQDQADKSGFIRESIIIKNGLENLPAK